MRDFSWKYFTVTGNIDAYLLYREHLALDEKQADGAEEFETMTEGEITS